MENTAADTLSHTELDSLSMRPRSGRKATETKIGAGTFFRGGIGRRAHLRSPPEVFVLSMSHAKAGSLTAFHIANITWLA